MLSQCDELGHCVPQGLFSRPLFEKKQIMIFTFQFLYVIQK